MGKLYLIRHGDHCFRDGISFNDQLFLGKGIRRAVGRGQEKIHLGEKGIHACKSYTQFQILSSTYLQEKIP